MVSGKQVLLIVGGGIAAYKALELVRLLRKRGIAVRAVLTKAGEEFVTPLSLSALTEDKIYTELFSLTDEAEMGHIQLSRSADLIVVAPATADMLAKMRAGLAYDLASTLLLATDTPVLAAPAMNIRMWTHAATQENVNVLAERGISFYRAGRRRHGLRRVRAGPYGRACCDCRGCRGAARPGSGTFGGQMRHRHQWTDI